MTDVWAASRPPAASALRTSRTGNGERSQRIFRISNSISVGCSEAGRAIAIFLREFVHRSAQRCH